MDTYGKIALAFILIIYFVTAFRLRFMANRTLKWTVLVIGLVIFGLGFSIDSGHSRELAGAVGLL
jgi:hypothetical protein